MSTGINPWGIVLLWGGVLLVGLLGSRWRSRLPVWAVSGAVFGAALCLLLGLLLLLP